MPPCSDFLIEEDRFDTAHDVADKFRQLMERWNNRFSFPDKSLVEQYQQGRCSLVCDLAIFVPDQFECSNAVSRQCPWAYDVLPVSLVFNANIMHNPHIHDWKQEPMFIENVEIVQGPQGIIPSTVRLYGIHDKLSDLWGGLLYQSAIDGRYHSISGFSKWEPSMVIKVTESAENNFIDGEIKRTLQIVKGVSDDRREILRNELEHLNLKNIISAVRIAVDAESVEATCSEKVNKAVKIIDVLFGPFNL